MLNPKARKPFRIEKFADSRMPGSMEKWSEVDHTLSTVAEDEPQFVRSRMFSLRHVNVDAFDEFHRSLRFTVTSPKYS